MAKTWQEVRQSTAFKALPDEAKEAARNEYFNDVVAPQVDTADLATARAEFDSDTKPSIASRLVEGAAKAVNWKQGLSIKPLANPDGSPMDTSDVFNAGVPEDRTRETAIAKERTRLAELNPGASPRFLDDAAADLVDNPKAKAPPMDRAAAYQKAGKPQLQAEIAADFDQDLEQRLNRDVSSRPVTAASVPAGAQEGISFAFNPAAEALQRQRDERSAQIKANAENLPGAMRGLGIGALQSAGMGAGTVGYLGDVVGAEDLKQWGLENYQALMQDAGAAKVAPTFTNINTAGDAGSWLAENLGYTAYQAAEAFASFGAGAAIGKQIGKEALVGIMAGAINNARQTVGSVYGEAKDEEARTGKKADLLKVAIGASLSAAVDTVADKFGLDSLAANAFKGNLLTRVGKGMGLQMGVQGGTEAAQLVPEEWGAGKNPFREGMGAQYIDEAAVGALGGAGPGIVQGLPSAPRAAAPIVPEVGVLSRAANQAAAAGLTVPPAAAVPPPDATPAGVGGIDQADLLNRVTAAAPNIPEGAVDASALLGEEAAPNIPPAAPNIEPVAPPQAAAVPPLTPAIADHAPTTLESKYEAAKAAGDNEAMRKLAHEINAERQKTKAPKAPQPPTAGAPSALSLGTAPNSAEPITVRDGVVHIGNYAAQDFDSGEDVRVAEGATPHQIRDALATAGVIGKGQKVFGLPKAPNAAAGGLTVQPTAIDMAAHEAATSPLNDKVEPSDAMKHAGNYAKGHTQIAGIDVAIENPQGSVRSGTDPSGKRWENTLQSHYGYFKRTEGKDGDQVDVFIKPGTPTDYAGPVFVVDQKKANGQFDEHKVMLGYADINEAKAGYLESYAKGWDGIKTISATPLNEFKDWLANGDTKKPFKDREVSQPKAEAAQQPAPAQRKKLKPTGNLLNDLKVLGGDPMMIRRIYQNGVSATESANDLGEIANRLRAPEFGYVFDDVNGDSAQGLAEHLSRVASGDASPLNAARLNAEAEQSAKAQHKEYVGNQAKEFGLKGIGGKRTLDVVEAEIAEVMAEREALSNNGRGVVDQIDSIPFDETGTADLAEAMRAMGFTEQEITDDLAKSTKTDQRAAGGTEERAQEGDSARAETTPTESGESGAAASEEGFGLAAQTDTDLAAKEARENDAKAADRERIKRESEAGGGLFQLSAPEKPAAMKEAEAKAKIGDLFAEPAAEATKPADDLDAMFDDILAEETAEQEPAAPTENKAKAKKEEKAAAPIEQGKVGMKLAAGQVVLTASGRQTTPFPKFATATGNTTAKHLQAVNQWLLQNAADEAKARGDDFNAPAFERGAANPKNISQADQDSAEEYLFGEQPAVVPSTLKPLVPDAAQDGAAKLRKQLVAVENEIVGIAGLAPDFIEDAMRSRKVPVSLKTQRNMLRADLREATAAQRTAGEAAASAAKNTAAGLADAIDGMGKLFGAGSGRLGSGLNFDEETYARAKPLFAQAIGHFQDAGQDLKEAMRAIIKAVLVQFGTAVAKNMQPYIVRYVADLRDGKLDAPSDALPDGWTEAFPGGMASSQDPSTGGIIDAEIVSGKWFVIPQNDAINKIEGLASRADAFKALKAALEKEQNVIDQRGGTDLERDRQDTATADGMGAQGVRAGRGSDEQPGDRRVPGAEDEDRSSDGSELSGRQAAAAGEHSDQSIYTGATTVSDGTAGSRVDLGSDRAGIDGAPIEPAATSFAEEVARLRPELIADQAKANQAPHGDSLAEVRAALPALLEGQQEDVFKAEQRYKAADGYGMLFTNGTGTGKTFTGLGVVRRFADHGKNNVLIVAPNDKIIEDWQAAGRVLGLGLLRLENTTDAGQGIVITTYANMGSNDALASRAWDLVVHDEAHYLAMDKDGTSTNALKTLRAITMHPDGWMERASMQNRELLDRLAANQKEIASLSSLMNNPDTMDQMYVSYRVQYDALDKQIAKDVAAWRAAQEAVKEDVASRQGEKRPRALFLSATPFAYEKTADWANGYLFDYNEGRGNEANEFRGYNVGSNRDQFMMQHFGYRMRTGKLTEPDAKVDRGLMQRQFNSWLKKRGALSGRMLDVKADYDRRFVLTESAIGGRIDDALQWFEGQRKEAKGNESRSKALYAVQGIIAEKFDYLSRRYLLEAIKAREVVPHVREHLAMGRKVVVFHDYKKGGGFNPFNISHRLPGQDETAATEVATINAVIDEFRSTFRDLINSDVFNSSSPIDAFKQEFPGVLLFNGDVSPKDRRANVAKFQDDASGPQVFLVQSAAGKEGISLHDTTGKHQRVLFNLGQPTAPTTAIQQEGRIYRTGQVTDAIFRYLNTGTNWEKWAFATTIAQRASAAENLGMGEMARALKDAFIAGFEESSDYRAGMEGEGKGGKERDRAANEALTEYDRARAFYFGTQKKTSKTKAQEGADYFATPEPVGLKMMEWASLGIGESVLEPSAGHGAIARWAPESAERTAIEPSMALRPRLAMVFDGTIIDSDFEDHNTINKYDAVVMNPPFGSGGKTAIDHVAKAAKHLRDGGRVVALIPTGPAADKKFEKWFYEEDSKPAKPLGTVTIDGKETPIYKGDTVESRASWAPTGVVTGWRDGAPMVKASAPEFRGAVSMVSGASIKSVQPTGPRTESFRPAAGLYLVADVKLPSVTFERAGTQVSTRIVVIEKQLDASKAPNTGGVYDKDLTDAGDINDLFDRLENMALPERIAQAKQANDAPAPAKAARSEAKKATTTALPETGQVKPAGEAASVEEIKDGKLLSDGPRVPYVTAKGKTIYGVLAKTLTKAQAKEVDNFTWQPKGMDGFFIRMEHVVRPGGDGAGMASRGQSPTGQSAAAVRAEVAAKIGANRLAALERKGLVKIHDDYTTLPPAGQQYPDTWGYFDGKQVHLVAANLSKGQAAGVFQHEVWHAALRSLRLSESPLYGKIMDRLGKIEQNGAAGKWFAEADAMIPAEDRGNERRRLNELAAYAIQQYETAPKSLPMLIRRFVEDLIASVRAFFMESLGWVPANLTAPDLAALTRRYVRSLSSGEAGAGPVGAAPQLISFSRLAELVKSPALLAFLKVASQPGAFQYGTSRAKDLATVLREVGQDRDGFAAIGIAEDGGNTIWVGGRNADGTFRKEMNIIGAETKTPYVVIEPDQKQTTGQGLYQSVMTWAHNNGKTLKPDSTLTAINRLRRNEAMISSMLRQLTSKHVYPSEWQFVGLLTDAEFKKTLDAFGEERPQGDIKRFAPEVHQKLMALRHQYFGSLESHLSMTPAQDRATFEARLQALIDSSVKLVERRDPNVNNLWVEPTGEMYVRRNGAWERTPVRPGSVVSAGLAARRGVGRASLYRAAVAKSAFSGFAALGGGNAVPNVGVVTRPEFLAENTGWREALAGDNAGFAGVARTGPFYSRGGDRAGSAGRGDNAAPDGDRIRSGAAPVRLPAALPGASTNAVTPKPRRRGVLDATLQVVGKPLAEKITGPAYNKILHLLTEAQAPAWVETIRAGVLSDYGLSADYLDRKVEMEAEITRHLRKAKDVTASLSALTRAESRVAYEWMNASPEALPEIERDLYRQLPEESRTVLDGIKAKIEEMSQEALRLGQLSPEAYARNKMAYIHRSYAKHVFGEDDAKRLTEIRGATTRVIGDQYKGRGMFLPLAAGKLEGPGDNFAPAVGQKFVRLERRNADGKVLERRWWPAGQKVPGVYADLEVDPAAWEVRALHNGKATVWRDFTKEERQRMGELDEVKFAVATTISKAAHDIEVGRFFEWVANEYGQAEAPEGATVIKAIDLERGTRTMLDALRGDTWVAVPDVTIPGTSVKKYGALAGQFVPGPVWNDIRQLRNKPMPFGETYAKLLRLWKSAKTALSPSVHMNNVMANVFMADMHDVGARDVYQALSTIYRASKGNTDAQKLMQRFEESGALSGTFVMADLKADLMKPLLDELRKEVESASDETAAQVTMGNVISLLTEKKFVQAMTVFAATKPARRAARLPALMIEAYQMEDSIFRLAAFMRAIEAGQSDREAGKASRSAFLDYNINAPWIANLRHTVLPFVAFTYRMIPMALEVAAKKPWKFAKYALVINGLSAASAALFMAGDDEEEWKKVKKMLPEDQQGKTIFGAERLIPLGKDQHGRFLTLNITRWMPLGDMLEVRGESSNVFPMWAPLYPGGPGVAVAEVFANRSVFSGREIWKATDTPAEQAGKVSDHLFKQWLPNVPIPNPIGWLGDTPGQNQTYSWAKIEQSLKGATDQFGRQYSLGTAALSSVGVKVSPYAIDALQSRTMYDFTSQKQEIQANIRRLQREHHNGALSQSAMERQVNEEIGKLRALEKQTREKVQ